MQKPSPSSENAPLLTQLLQEILSARVYDLAEKTPLDKGEKLSTELKNNVYLKREDLQPAFSFKVRGAYNCMSKLTPEERQKGVICVSAGNHAQGVGLSARYLGIDATVVMPTTTPQIKVEAVKKLGCTVLLQGKDYTEAAKYADELVLQENKKLIHPFDDLSIIAGQGTLGLELLQQCPDLDILFLPVGGGGLIAGVGGFFRAVSSKVRILGVEPEDAASMHLALSHGTRKALKKVGTFADGVAVRRVGETNFPLAQACIDGMLQVGTDEICSAIKAIYEDTRAIVEPAGALAVAGMRKYVRENQLTGKTLVAINSGANMNFQRLQFIAERTLTGEKREALFAVRLKETPGSLRDFYNMVVCGRALTEFNYRLSHPDLAYIFVGVEVTGEAEKLKVEEGLKKHHYEYVDLTDNELAKSHIRHMVGGKPLRSTNEIVYSFRVPEKGGALREVLEPMKKEWNISLFHYRMHGADFGKVLIGFEIDSEEKLAFQAYLKELPYPHKKETLDKAYRLFL